MNHYVDRASLDCSTVPLVLFLIDLTYRQERQRKLVERLHFIPNSFSQKIRTHHGQTNGPIEVAVPEMRTKVMDSVVR